MSLVWPGTNPRIFITLEISSLFLILSSVASLTFNTFPLSGNTPYKSLPITPSPATASALAESPSVRIRVHFAESALPA